jgi:hypothetical protein
VTAYLWTTLVLNALVVLVMLSLKVGHVSKPWTEVQIRVITFMRFALVVWAAVLLASCGGTDDEDDKNASTNPPQCAASSAPCR